MPTTTRAARPSRSLALLLSLLLAAAHLVVAPISAHAAPSTTVVINEMATRGPAGATDNFIELRNVADEAVDISGWRIQRCNNSGFTGTQVTVEDHVMPPGGHYLVAHTDFSGSVTPDATYGVSIADTGGGRILDASGEVVDGVGFADTDNRCTEGAPAPALTTTQGNQGMAYTRDEQGTDTDDNATDFSLAARTPTPSDGSAGDQVTRATRATRATQVTRAIRAIRAIRARPTGWGTSSSARSTAAAATPALRSATTTSSCSTAARRP